MNRTAFWVAPGATVALALAFHGPFGLGRDVGAFLIGLMLVPLLGLIALVLGAWALLERKPRRKEIVISSSIAALAPAILIPMLWLYGDPLRDPARFAVWAATHPSDLAAARRHKGVFRHWDGWGMAGSENDSYLAGFRAAAMGHGALLERTYDFIIDTAHEQVSHHHASYCSDINDVTEGGAPKASGMATGHPRRVAPRGVIRFIMCQPSVATPPRELP